MSTRQGRIGDADDLPECDVGGCHRDALWHLRCDARDYDATALRCDEHRDEPEPFVGAWGATLEFTARRLRRQDVEEVGD